MLFNSFEFVLFFVVVYVLYLVSSHRLQNRMLLVASYCFYGFWDKRFLLLILLSTITDFYCGLKIDEKESERERKFFLILSIFINLSILGFFKYFNFFYDNFARIWESFGWYMNRTTLKIILPVGISFYTFQSLSYTIDIYKRKMKPTRNLFDFALFVSFFPQLVAGPIERAKDFLPQIFNPRKIRFDQFYEGFYLFLWGLYQKVFIADNLGKYVDKIYSHPQNFSSPELIIATYAFAFQILCDFSGYSCMARGIAKWMGFELRTNFNLPYFATNPQDFWRRWHMSLSNWLKDYIFIPLGGSLNGVLNTIRNLFLTMVLGGLWHGASFAFVVWGGFHGILLAIHRICLPVLDAKSAFWEKVGLSRFWLFLRVIVFFQLVCIGWVFFRAESLSRAFEIFYGVLQWTGMEDFSFWMFWKHLLSYLWLLLPIQCFQFYKKDLYATLKIPFWFQGLFYLVMAYSILFYGVDRSEAFIYFQF